MNDAKYGPDASCGDSVRWIRGAVGLVGEVIELVQLPDALPGFRLILKIETPAGLFAEYPSNLERVGGGEATEWN